MAMACSKVKRENRDRRKITQLRNTMRPSRREPDQLRNVRITRGYTRYAEGSVLIECGETRVVCTVSIDDKVPPFLRGKGQGWLTAEYGMLPLVSNARGDR